MIDKITGGFGQIAPIPPIRPDAQIRPGQNAEKKTSFAEMLGSAMQGVNQLQLDADRKVEQMVLGQDGVSPHTAMVAMEKADMAFQLMTGIKSKIIQAYQEVMRTQV